MSIFEIGKRWPRKQLGYNRIITGYGTVIIWCNYKPCPNFFNPIWLLHVLLVVHFSIATKDEAQKLTLSTWHCIIQSKRPSSSELASCKLLSFGWADELELLRNKSYSTAGKNEQSTNMTINTQMYLQETKHLKFQIQWPRNQTRQSSKYATSSCSLGRVISKK